MATFALLSPDAFATQFRGLVEETRTDRSVDPKTGLRIKGIFDHVRRPVRGIQFKDETFATLQVRTADGRNFALFDAGGKLGDDKNPTGGRTARYSNFLLQGVTESRQEKTQIVQTFGESYVFFYGEQPRTLEITGVLLNSEDFNWRAEWWENYEKYLRGTACVRSRSRVVLSWDDIVVEGYLLASSAQDAADNINMVQFQFTMFLTDYANVSRIGDPEFPRGGMELELDPLATDTTGEGVGNLKSSTLQVRELNQLSELTHSSLLSAIQTGISAVVSVAEGGIAGGLGFGFSLAFAGLNIEALLSGRLVRVPVGFGGSEVFNDAQFALQSFPDAGRGEVSILDSALNDFSFSFYANLPKRFMPARYGLISENLDEYVGRLPPASDKPGTPPDLFAAQLEKDQELVDQARDIFERFGVPVDPPPEFLVLAARAAFGAFSVGVGAALV